MSGVFDVPPTFAAFLTWIGTIEFFNIAGAPLLERLFVALKVDNSNIKALVSVLTAVGLALASAALVKWLPGGLVAGVDQWYQVIIGAVVGWLTMQGAHYQIDLRAKRITPPGSSG